MPSKGKNTRKRSRDDSDRLPGPPKKRAKKAAPNTDETTLRRSSRTRRQAGDWWKSRGSASASSSASGSEDDDGSDSDDSRATYNVPTRRTGSRSQRNKNHSQKSKKKKRSKSSNSQRKNKKKSSLERTKNSQKGSHSDVESADDGHSKISAVDSTLCVSADDVPAAAAPKRKRAQRPPQRQQNDRSDLSSPHRSQAIRSLPDVIHDLKLSTDRHLETIRALFGGDGATAASAESNALNAGTLKAIKAALSESAELRTAESAMNQALCAKHDGLHELGAQCRSTLNGQIEAINRQHTALKGQFVEQMNDGMARIQRMEQKTASKGDGNGEEAEYRILYEASQQKMKAMSAEMESVRSEMTRCREATERQRSQSDAEAVEQERAHRGEVQRLRSGHRIEVKALEMALKSVEAEFADFKLSAEAKYKMQHNADALCIDNLKRENLALSDELTMARQSVGTLSPHSAAISPTPCIARKGAVGGTVGAEGNEFSQRIRASPLNERVQNELLSISKRKELENAVQGLQSELLSVKTQLEAKKAVIKEFEEMLRGEQREQKAVWQQLSDLKKINNLYSVLTATKIQRKAADDRELRRGSDADGDGAESKQQELGNDGAVVTKQEGFECRTVHRDRDQMLEFLLSFGCSEEEEASPFLDYRLVAAHNLEEDELSESLRSDITFYAKNAPMFLATVFRQMFTK